jgi:hypothetical protein
MLRKTCLSLAIVAASLFAIGETHAQVSVNGYHRHNAHGGTSYVRPYHRTQADTSFYNNWSSYPNVNPYTSHVGTHHRPSYGYGGGLGSTPRSTWSFWGW